MGATDPPSGTASAHEVVRGLGALLRLGWKPLRTIVIASWDAEEVGSIIRRVSRLLTWIRKYGLIGSTEWGEDFADWIDEHVVAYLNLGMHPFSDIVADTDSCCSWRLVRLWLTLLCLWLPFLGILPA